MLPHQPKKQRVEAPRGEGGDGEVERATSGETADGGVVASATSAEELEALVMRQTLAFMSNNPRMKRKYPDLNHDFSYAAGCFMGLHSIEEKRAGGPDVKDDYADVLKSMPAVNGKSSVIGMGVEDFRTTHGREPTDDELDGIMGEALAMVDDHRAFTGMTSMDRMLGMFGGGGVMMPIMMGGGGILMGAGPPPPGLLQAIQALGGGGGGGNGGGGRGGGASEGDAAARQAMMAQIMGSMMGPFDDDDDDDGEEDEDGEGEEEGDGEGHGHADEPDHTNGHGAGAGACAGDCDGHGARAGKDKGKGKEKGKGKKGKGKEKGKGKRSV